MAEITPDYTSSIAEPNTTQFSESWPPSPTNTSCFVIPVRQRRVGSFTLGITLILLGVLIPLGIIFGEAVWVYLKFAPVVLLLLGLEIVIYSLRKPDGKLKYDGFSIFLILMLTIITLVTSAIVPPISSAVRVTKEGRFYQENAQVQMEDLMYQAGLKGTVHCYINNYDDIIFGEFEATKNQFHLGGYLNVSELSGLQNPTKEEAVEKVTQFMNSLSQTELTFEYLNLVIKDQYELNLNRSDLRHVTNTLVADRIEILEQPEDFTEDFTEESEY